MQSSLQPLCLSLEKLHRVKDSMLEAMDRGLSRQTHAQATVRMLPTFIRSTPDGTGKGPAVGARGWGPSWYQPQAPHPWPVLWGAPELGCQHLPPHSSWAVAGGGEPCWAPH